MKRHRSLYPLSHDHHHGLVQARQLSLAGQENACVVAERFVEFWEGDLQRHFRQEEEIALPLIEEYAASDRAIASETLRQHDEIRRLVARLNDEMARGAGVDAGLLGQIGGAIRDHIRFEENELFPVLERFAPEEALWRMNERLTSGEGAPDAEIEK